MYRRILLDLEAVTLQKMSQATAVSSVVITVGPFENPNLFQSQISVGDCSSQFGRVRVNSLPAVSAGLNPHSSGSNYGCIDSIVGANY